MRPSRNTRLARISDCLTDLAGNGISTDHLGHRALCLMARENLDYFQAMLGYDAAPWEIVWLMEHARDSETRRVVAGGVAREGLDGV